MPTQILAVGTSASDSADVVVAVGTPLTVALKDASGADGLGRDVLVNILLKDDAGQYFPVDSLHVRKPALMIVAAGTYRFSRVAGDSCGVFSG